MGHDKQLMPHITSVDSPGDWSLQSSSAFSDCCSCMDSLDTFHGCRTNSEDYRSEMGSVSSGELSVVLDENVNEWPFLRVCDCRSSRQRVPVMENFVTELRPCVPISHGLLRVSCGRNWSPVRSAQYAESFLNGNCSRGIDNAVDVSNCQVSEKTKEHTSRDVRETETFACCDSVRHTPVRSSEVLTAASTCSELLVNSSLFSSDFMRSSSGSAILPSTDEFILGANVLRRSPTADQVINCRLHDGNTSMSE